MEGGGKAEFSPRKPMSILVSEEATTADLSVTDPPVVVGRQTSGSKVEIKMCGTRGQNGQVEKAVGGWLGSKDGGQRIAGWQRGSATFRLPSVGMAMHMDRRVG